MSAAMERDSLCDASGLQPVLQRCLSELVGETIEDYTCSSLANQLQCLVADRIVHQFLGLLHSKCDIHTSVSVGLYVLPSELLDITLSQSSQTGKEEGGLQDCIFARRVRQPYQLILGQISCSPFVVFQSRHDDRDCQQASPLYQLCG